MPFFAIKDSIFTSFREFPFGSMGIIALKCVLYDANLLVCDSEALLLCVERFSGLYLTLLINLVCDNLS